MGRAERETLRVLKEGGDTYQADLVRATGFSKATISEVLASLEKRNLVRRTALGRNSRVSLVGREPRHGKSIRFGFTRSAEYPFLIPLRRALREEGILVDFRVYDNGVDAARDLSNLRLDVAIAPIPTLFMFHALEAPFKLLGPAGSGGSSILARPGGSSREGGSAVCTKLSTMELLMRSALAHHAVPEVKTIAYAHGPAEIGEELMSGSADLCSIWEPYATLLEARGARRLLRYSDISDHVCCALAAGNHLGEPFVARLAKRHTAALEELRRDREGPISSYSSLAGLESALVRKVTREYTYPSGLSPRALVAQLEDAGVTTPSPSSFQDAIVRE